MVFVITGTAESDRNIVGRLLADDLGWEFVDARNLPPSANFEARNRNPSPANADPSLRIETLLAAISFWIYEWRDVVLSCPTLTEKDRRQLSAMSSLVKILCVEASHATGRTSDKEALRTDSSGQVETLIAEIVSALVLRPRSLIRETGDFQKT